jgi:hypothetical protein
MRLTILQSTAEQQSARNFSCRHFCAVEAANRDPLEQPGEYGVLPNQKKNERERYADPSVLSPATGGRAPGIRVQQTGVGTDYADGQALASQ